MNQSAILFRSPPILVHRTTDTILINGQLKLAELKFEDMAFNLDLHATRLLVDYLKVIRAFSSSDYSRRNFKRLQYSKVISELQILTQRCGRQIVRGEEISQIIHSLGCTIDWADGPEN